MISLFLLLCASHFSDVSAFRTLWQIAGPEDLASLLERGALCRATASTNMNAHSSRSHAICTLTFEVVRPATEETQETTTSSCFQLVDLAGSERAKKTGAEVKAVGLFVWRRIF